MDEVRNEILEKVNQYKSKEKERRKHENIHLITSEKDFFKDEAVRLNLICRAMSLKNEEFLKENKILSTEVDNLSKKWKESENINKQLLIELERNIDKNIENEKKIDQLYKEINKISNSLLPHQNKNEDVYLNKEIDDIYNSDIEKLDVNIEEYNTFKEKCIKIVENVKLNQKKERLKYTNMIKDLTLKVKERTNLEIYLKDCFINVSSEIQKRKYNKESKEGKDLKEIKPIKFENINFKSFSSLDKEKLLNNFLLNDQVIALIQDAIFNNNKQSMNNTHMNSTTSNPFMMKTGVTFPSLNKQELGNTTLQSFAPFMKSNVTNGFSFMNNNWIKTKSNFFNKSTFYSNKPTSKLLNSGLKA